MIYSLFSFAIVLRAAASSVLFFHARPACPVTSHARPVNWDVSSSSDVFKPLVVTRQFFLYLIKESGVICCELMNEHFETTPAST